MKSRVHSVTFANPEHVLEVTTRRTRTQLRRKAIASVLGLAVAGFIGLNPAASLANEFVGDGGASPVRGHMQVVAQTLVRIGEDEVSWYVTDGEVDGEGSLLKPDSRGFLLGGDGVLLVRDGATGDEVRLAEGEALALRDGGSYEQTALGEDEAAFYVIGFGVEGSDGLFAGEPTDELLGLRDIDLLRDRLKANEKAKLPEGDGPTLILATDGEITVTSSDLEKPRKLEGGEAAEFTGTLEIRAGDDEAASYVAGVIGENLESRSGEEPKPGDGDLGGTGGGGSTSDQVPAVQVDTDGDGLFDDVEEAIGTDPSKPDTDLDGLTDGEEVNVYGSDPLSMDGDGDGLPDYNEIMQQGTDPMNPDTDGDGLNDHDETSYQTDPLDSDSDGDGLLDGEEFNYPADPLDADTDDDGLSDGDEGHVYGSHPNNIDTDGDGLPDYNEVMQHGTNPAVADTDADNINDHDELSYGTSLLDPDSDGDGALDGDEIFGGYDPLDPNSKP